MTSRRHGKLFAVIFLPTLAVFIAGGLYLRSELRSSLSANAERELLGAVQLAASVARLAAPTADLELPKLAEELSNTTGLAIDYFTQADQETREVPPVVTSAWTRGLGIAEQSDGGHDYLAVARSFDFRGRTAVAYVRRPLDEAPAALTSLRTALLVILTASALLAALVARTAVAATVRVAPVAPLPRTEEERDGEPATPSPEITAETEGRIAAASPERAGFEAVLEAIADAVIALDEHHQVTLMNSAAHKMLGVGPSDQRRSLLEICRAPELQDLVASSSDEEEPAKVEFDQPSTERRLLARMARLRGGGTVLVLQDVTDLRRLETVRRDFVANVSHELRTPISIVRANLETLIDGAMTDPKHGPRLASAALRNAERLTAILEDLLDLSRIEADRYEVKQVSVSVADAAARAIESVKRPVLVEIPAELNVLADPQALDQVLVNLLDNAAKYTPSDADVTVRARGAGERIRIEVCDTGPGLEPRHRARVFERFFRVDPGRSREMGGTGLGLSIVKNLVEAMGGTVGVDANDPRGAIFWFDLPPA